MIAVELEQALKKTVRGEVRFDAGSRALYATDASNYRQVPLGLVVPRDADDVIAAVAACRRFGAPVLPRGAGTSLAGQCCNVAVVLDFTKYMNRILEIDPERRFARVEPGVVLDSLRSRAETDRLTFGPDPSTHSRCTLGGMIGNNSCGTHSLLAGKTVDNVEELRVLLYDGTEMTVGATSDTEFEAIKRAGGTPRADLFPVARAFRSTRRSDPREVSQDSPPRVRLQPRRAAAGARVSPRPCACGQRGDVRDRARRESDADSQVRSTGRSWGSGTPTPSRRPITCRRSSRSHRSASRVSKAPWWTAFAGRVRPTWNCLPPGRGVLLVEFGSDDPGQASDTAARMVESLKRSITSPVTRLYTPAESRAVWKLRESGPRAAANMPGAPPRWEGWDDAAVAPERLGPYLRDLRRLLDAYEYNATFYGHFGHGCIHMQVSFDLQSQAGVAKYGAFVSDAADLVVRYDGSLSGEHGDGKSRSALLPKMFGAELMAAFGEFKSAWDPDNKLNPHNIVNARPATEDLRLGAAYAPLKLPTRFEFPDDGGSMANATLRCIGIGECRKQDAGAMCPSYMVTLEEEHSTRGRARMLFELLRGDVVAGGWNDEQVKRSLDLCLSCKACKSECPTNVDIATYRAEFLSHYYERHRRPLHAYAFGMVDRWLEMASLAPSLANALTQAPGINSVVKKALDIAPQRTIPRLAPVSFRKLARARHVPTDGGDVILWVDTFNNSFHPETSQAALDVLTAAGCKVFIPRQRLCCGRPLYDFGLIDQAVAYLRRILDVLAEPIDAGIPVVVLEPSCASVFRDELRNLLPSDLRAGRLRAQTFLLSEFLERRVPGYIPPRLAGPLVLHGHCHHKALMKMSDEESLLRKMGADVQSLDAGCCGMAGSFGFDSGKFNVSMAIGERVLLPAVRQADPATPIVSDGFSCREQIAQATGRQALHLADVMKLALTR